MTDAALVVARGLRKRYGAGPAAVTALDGVDLNIRAGELLAITGRSGSGKTTLLHCLSGITTPDEGSVTFDGVELTDAKDAVRSDLRATRMAFVFQNLNLLPALTVAENVELPLVLRGDDASVIRARSATALEEVGLGGRGDAMPSDLSGGEQQRVAVARALIGRPDIIWADEPTGALDTATSAEVMKLMRAVVQADRTVVVISHSAEVAGLADRTVAMSDGRVVSTRSREAARAD